MAYTLHVISTHRTFKATLHPYSPSRRKFFALSMITLLLLLGLLIPAAYFMGASPNALNSDDLVVGIYFVVAIAASSVWFLAVTHICSPVKSFFYEKFALTASALFMVAVIGPVVALLGIRIASLDYLMKQPTLHMNECDPFAAAVLKVGNATPSGIIAFDGSGGLNAARWRWATQQPHSAYLRGQPNATTYLLLERGDDRQCNPVSANTTAETNQSRVRVAFLVPATAADGRNFSVADLPVDPLAAFPNRPLTIRSALHVKYFMPFSREAIQQTALWYHSPPWQDAHERIPLIIATGTGTIGQHKVNLPSYSTLRSQYVTGVVAVIVPSTVLFMTLCVISLCAQRRENRLLAACVAVGLCAAICNGIVMIVTGSVCLNYPESRACMMSPDGAVGLIALGCIAFLVQSNMIIRMK